MSGYRFSARNLSLFAAGNWGGLIGNAWNIPGGPNVGVSGLAFGRWRPTPAPSPCVPDCQQRQPGHLDPPKTRAVVSWARYIVPGIPWHEVAQPRGAVGYPQPRGAVASSRLLRAFCESAARVVGELSESPGRVLSGTVSSGGALVLREFCGGCARDLGPTALWGGQGWSPQLSHNPP